MKKKFTPIIVFLLFFAFAARSYAQELNAIQTVVPFLTIAPDSRAGAIGDAGVATSPDAFSMHWNPAKFAFIEENAGVGISYAPWLRNLVPDINIATLAGFYRIDAKQVLSSSLVYSSLGDVPFTDEYGNLERTFKPNEFSFDVGYSRLFSENFSGGIAFRFIYSNLQEDLIREVKQQNQALHLQQISRAITKRILLCSVKMLSLAWDSISRISDQK